MALGASQRPFRAISLAGGADLISPPWGAVRHHFQTPMQDFDTNIVCGHPAFLDRLWTSNMTNIAIVGGGRTTIAGLEQAREPLKKYDEIWVADESLFDYYFNTLYVPPWAAVAHLARKAS